MNDIFSDENIYPHEGKIKKHFEGVFESVFIAFLPFFQIPSADMKTGNQKAFSKITLEEAIQKNPIYEKLKPSVGRHIYSYDSKDYPSPLNIFKNGIIIDWQTVINNCGLKDDSELNKALRTSIGALRTAFHRPDLSALLDKYITDKKIWQPVEGCFDILSKISIYKTFELFGKKEIVVTDEFYQTSSTLNLNNLNEYEFSEKINFKDYYIYSLDREILFTIEWDSFFFLIATDQRKMNKIISEKLFEGFFCDDDTEHSWDYNDDELQSLLDKERKIYIKH